MKDLTYLYTSFQGRLSRSAFWPAAGLLIAAEIGLTAALARTMGAGWRDFVHADRRTTWILLVVVAFFFWPSLSLCVKRLHDRDLPGWWAALLHVLVFVFYADQAAIRPLIRDKATLFVAVLPAMMLFLVGMWMLIELVLLAGKPQDNRYGPYEDKPQPEPDALAVSGATPHPGE